VQWVRRQPGGVIVQPRGAQAERHDVLFLACHSDDALALLADASRAEREVLGAIPYQGNEAVLHTDARLLPRRRLAHAAWNYHVLADRSRPVALTYHMNILQRLDTPRPLLVTLNRSDEIDPARVIRRITYRHPLFTPAAVAAQARQREIDGVRDTYFCGAYWRNGFHEDGVASALEAVAHFEADHAQRAVRRSA
jgi:predicted NAD/FAD-binding protein